MLGTCITHLYPIFKQFQLNDFLNQAGQIFGKFPVPSKKNIFFFILTGLSVQVIAESKKQKELFILKLQNWLHITSR